MNLGAKFNFMKEGASNLHCPVLEASFWKSHACHYARCCSVVYCVCQNARHKPEMFLCPPASQWHKQTVLKVM